MTRLNLTAAIAVAGAMALGAGPVAAQEANVQPQPVTKDSEVTPTAVVSKFDPNAKICKKVTYTGSRLGTAKICKKRSEWAERAYTDQKQTERIQHNTKPHISR